MESKNYRREQNTLFVHKRAMVISILLGLLVLVLTMPGCSIMGGGGKDEITTTSTTKPVTTAAPAPIKTTTPKLEEKNYSLAIKPPEMFKECTLPLYLNAKDTLHFQWMVSGAGETVRIAFTIPSGEYVAVAADSSFYVSTPDEPCEELLRHGAITLNPTEQEWAAGYYTFYPQIYEDDSPIELKILYWIN